MPATTSTLPQTEIRQSSAGGGMTSAGILSDLVGFDTTSRNSNLPLIEYIEEYLAGLGVASHRITDDTGDKANLWATIGPDVAGGTILSGHTDTVPVDGQTWTSDPFVLTARDQNLYGRGSCDMKGFIACALAAVPQMIAAPLRRPIHLAFSYDEEVGCTGVIGLIDWLAAQASRPALCLVGEPTMMQVGLGHKTKRSMRVTVRGRSCHSSLAPEGLNAVEYGALLVARMREIGQRLAREGGRDEAYDVAHTTAHVGTFHGGTALNIVPDDAVIQCEFRVLPQEDADALVAELREYADDLQRQMQRIDPQAGIEVDLYAQFPGLDTPAGSPAAALAMRLADTNRCVKVAYGTEGGRFAEGLDLPVIICGPGSITQAHKPDEFVACEQLDRCDRFLSGLIEDSCGDPLPR